MQFSEQFISARRTKGLSQAKLSKLTKIPKRTIEDWETGRRTPPEYVQEMVLEKIELIDSCASG